VTIFINENVFSTRYELRLKKLLVVEYMMLHVTALRWMNLTPGVPRHQRSDKRGRGVARGNLENLLYGGQVVCWPVIKFT